MIYINVKKTERNGCQSICDAKDCHMPVILWTITQLETHHFILQACASRTAIRSN